MDGFWQNGVLLESMANAMQYLNNTRQIWSEDARDRRGKLLTGIWQWWTTPCGTWRAFCWLTALSLPLTIWDGRSTDTGTLYFQILRHGSLHNKPEPCVWECKCFIQKWFHRYGLAYTRIAEVTSRKEFLHTAAKVGCSTTNFNTFQNRNHCPPTFDSCLSFFAFF